MAINAKIIRFFKCKIPKIIEMIMIEIIDGFGNFLLENFGKVLC